MQTHKMMTVKRTRLGHTFGNTEEKYCTVWRNY